MNITWDSDLHVKDRAKLNSFRMKLFRFGEQGNTEIGSEDEEVARALV